MSGEFRIELDKKTWAEFKRQLYVASTNLQDGRADLKDVINEAAQPLAQAWRTRLPGSTAGTVKVMRNMKGTVRAGWASPKGDHPFLPWVEFGGTVVWKAKHSPYTRVPVYGHRMRKLMFIKLPREPGGRFRRPAINASIGEVAQKLGDGVQRLLNKYFS